MIKLIFILFFYCTRLLSQEAYPVGFEDTEQSISETFEFSRSKDWGSFVNGKSSYKHDGIIDYEVAYHIIKIHIDFSRCDKANEMKISLWFNNQLSRGGMSIAVAGHGIIDPETKVYTPFKKREDRAAVDAKKEFDLKYNNKIEVIGTSWDAQKSLGIFSCQLDSVRGRFGVIPKSRVSTINEDYWKANLYEFEWSITVEPNVLDSRIDLTANVTKYFSFKNGKYLLPGKTHRGPIRPDVTMGSPLESDQGHPLINVHNIDFEKHGIFIVD